MAPLSTPSLDMIPRLEAHLQELGRSLLQWRAAGLTEAKWSGVEVKADADRMAHDFLHARLTQLAPGIPVVSEEDTAGHAGPRPLQYWIIDPIDGTASWLGGFAGFVTQAALIENELPQLAVIVAPAINVTYTAARGHGARRNGKALRRRDVTSRILTDNYPRPRGIAAEAFVALQCTGYLESGSLALKMCRVADNGADLFIKNVPVRDWDMAAPALVLHEAGASFSLLSGTPYRFRGPLEKHGGIVAAATEQERQATVNWYSRRSDQSQQGKSQ